MPVLLRGLLWLWPWAAAQAQPAAPQPTHLRRIAIVILAGSGLEPDLASDLTEVLVAAVASREGLQVIGKEEVQARLGQDEAQSRECIESPICLGNLGTELGVSEVIAGTVALQGSGFRVALVRQEITTGRVLGRLFRDVEGEPSRLVASVREWPEVLFAEASESDLQVTSIPPGAEVFVDDELRGTTPVTLHGLSRERHTLRVAARGFQPETRTATPSGRSLRLHFELRPLRALRTESDPPGPTAAIVCWTSLGLAASALGIATWQGLASREEVSRGATQRSAELRLNENERHALAANIAFGIAGVLGTVGLALLLFKTEAVLGRAGDRGWSAGGLPFEWRATF